MASTPVVGDRVAYAAKFLRSISAFTGGTPQARRTSTMRTVREIAREIAADWKNVNYAAKPYLRAMLADDFGCDGAKSVVLYFLSNAGSWRGEVAKRVKAELKGMAR